MVKGILKTPMLGAMLGALLLPSFSFANNDIQAIERACRGMSGHKFKKSAPRINEAQTEQCFDTLCYKIVGDAQNMPLNEGVFESLHSQLQELQREGAAIVSFQADRCFPYEAPNFDEYVIRDRDGSERRVGFDVWARLCGEDGSRCRLDGDVWVVLGGNDNGNSNGNSNGNRNGNSNGDGWYIHTEGNTRFRCAYYMSVEECIGDEANIIISTSGDGRHCVDCSSGSGRGGAYGTLSGIAEVAGAVLPPVMGYLGVKAGADAYLGANQAWAGACEMTQSNYINAYYADVQAQRDYVMQNELPDREFGGNMDMPGCNGYGMGMFAGGMGFMGNGMGGFGNPWGAAGYSPGFVGGMYGPYGQYNPYGSVNGMFGNPYGMGGNPYGMGGQFGINIGIGGPGGMYGGPGGNPWHGGAGGWGGPGGMYGGPGGMYGNGGVMCVAAPCPGGPGWGPGVGGNFGINIGMGGPGGMYGGPGGGQVWAGGTPGFYGNGGMHGNPWGGPGGAGVTPWGNGAGSYWNGSGGWGQGGAGWGNVAQSYMQNQQAYAQGNMYQQQALYGQYNEAGRNLWSNGYQNMNGGWGQNYGYAPYSPGNMGLSLSAGWGFGF